MDSTLLKQRLAALRTKAAEAENTSATSEATNPTSLETFIRLYNKCGRECYLDYMAGAKALYKYLSPIEIPTDIIFNSSLCNAALFHVYEIDKLAVILSEGELNNLSKINYISNLIAYYTAKHIMEEVTE